MAAVDAVRGLADEVASGAGLVVEDVAVQAAGRRRVVRVVVDLPEDVAGGVPMDAVAAVSQALSQRLDESDAMGGAAYTLEVSSPGVDRPLTQRRHWSRARGRLGPVAPRRGRPPGGGLGAGGSGARGGRGAPGGGGWRPSATTVSSSTRRRWRGATSPGARSRWS